MAAAVGWQGTPETASDSDGDVAQGTGTWMKMTKRFVLVWIGICFCFSVRFLVPAHQGFAKKYHTEMIR